MASVNDHRKYILFLSYIYGYNFCFGVIFIIKARRYFYFLSVKLSYCPGPHEWCLSVNIPAVYIDLQSCPLSIASTPTLSQKHFVT